MLTVSHKGVPYTRYCRGAQRDADQRSKTWCPRAGGAPGRRAAGRCPARLSAASADQQQLRSVCRVATGGIKATLAYFNLISIPIDFFTRFRLHARNKLQPPDYFMLTISQAIDFAVREERAREHRKCDCTRLVKEIVMAKNPNTEPGRPAPHPANPRPNPVPSGPPTRIRQQPKPGPQSPMGPGHQPARRPNPGISERRAPRGL